MTSTLIHRLVFPAILLLYLCGTTLVLSKLPHSNVVCYLLLSLCAALVIMIGFLDNTGLYCGSQDQIHAVASGNQTGFCTFTGTEFES